MTENTESDASGEKESPNNEQPQLSSEGQGEQNQEHALYERKDSAAISKERDSKKEDKPDTIVHVAKHIPSGLYWCLGLVAALATIYAAFKPDYKSLDLSEKANPYVITGSKHRWERLVIPEGYSLEIDAPSGAITIEVDELVAGENASITYKRTAPEEGSAGVPGENGQRDGDDGTDGTDGGNGGRGQNGCNLKLAVLKSIDVKNLILDVSGGTGGKGGDGGHGGYGGRADRSKRLRGGNGGKGGNTGRPGDGGDAGNITFVCTVAPFSELVASIIPDTLGGDSGPHGSPGGGGKGGARRGAVAFGAGAVRGGKDNVRGKVWKGDSPPEEGKDGTATINGKPWPFEVRQ